MMARLIDHLWQSWLCLIVIALILLLLRRNAARVRLWLWSIATLKFAVPFTLLYAIGAWMGFPVVHAGDPAPAWLLTFCGDLRPWLAPAQWASLNGGAALAAVVLLLAISAGWSVTVARQWRFERALARWELIQEEADGAPATRPVGFVKAAILTSLALCTVSAALLAGAVHDRQRRHADLAANMLALRQARIIMKEAAPGMGTRSRVSADVRGVSIRNANLQELVAFAFGTNRSAVYINQMISSTESDPGDFWLISPRYDIRIDGPVREPSRFEAYALHPLVTRMLAERFGVEIHVDGMCQAPCGRHGLRMGQ